MVRLTISIYPPPYGQLFCVCILFKILIICVLKRILHKKTSTFMQLLESPIPPLTAAHLIVGGYF